MQMNKACPIILILFATAAVYAQTALVVADRADLRGSRSNAGKIVETLRRDFKVEIIKEEPGWLLVQTTDFVGWLASNSVRVNRTQTASLDKPIQSGASHSAALPTRPATLLPQQSNAGPTYILGPRGGCYYMRAQGGKVYVDHSFCTAKPPAR